MALYLSKVDKGVQTELESRIKDLSSNGKWATTRTPWIKATSFVAIADAKDYDAFQKSVENITKNSNLFEAPLTKIRVNNEYTKLESKADNKSRNEFILYSANKVDFDSSYNVNSSYKLRPVPVITGLRVNYKGEIGSTKRAVLKFKCFTPEDFESMHTLYMSIGKTVFVEWGWSINSSGEPVSLLPNTVKKDADKLKDIESNRKNNKFNYDAFQGRVVNFQFNINNDLSYDCEIELMTLGDTILSLNNGMSGENKIDNESKIVTSLNALLSEIKKGNEDKDLYRKFRINGDRDRGNPDGFTIGGRRFFGGAGIIGETDSEENKAEIEAFDGDSDTSEPYISWKCLLQKINEAYGSADKDGNPTAKFNPDLAVFIPWNSKLISCDPFVCIFSNQALAESSIDEGDNTSLKFNIDKYTCAKGLPKSIITKKENLALIEKIGSRTGNTLHTGNYTSLNLIWFNLYYVRDTFLASESPIDFFTKLLQEVSDCLGNICNLVVETDEDNPGYCSVVDLNVTAKKDEEVYEFYLVTPAGTKKSKGFGLIKDINIKSRLTEALKTAALYSNTLLPINSGNGAINTGGRKLSFRSIDLANKGPLDIGTEEPKETADYRKEKDQLEGVTDADKFRIAFNNLADNRDDETVRKAKVMLKEYLHKMNSDEERADQKNIIFPLDLSIKIDGISGLKYGNAFKMGDYLPNIYLADNVRFQIRELSHIVSIEGWELTIEGLMRIS